MGIGPNPENPVHPVQKNRRTDPDKIYRIDRIEWKSNLILKILFILSDLGLPALTVLSGFAHDAKQAEAQPVP